MKTAMIIDQAAKLVSHEWKIVSREVPAFLHAVGDFAASAPSNVWAMCAFSAAASIMVTLVTVYLWPNHEEVAPEREPTGAVGVRQLARSGHGPSDIARKTGLSHDAVVTILRASELPRGERTAPMRKSRPSAA
jgi:hypothetical protein